MVKVEILSHSLVYHYGSLLYILKSIIVQHMIILNHYDSYALTVIIYTPVVLYVCTVCVHCHVPTGAFWVYTPSKCS